jgi:serine/threonine protein kinase/tetratricopeptide (TPR) repeat protein
MSHSLDQRDPIEALAEEFMDRKRRGEEPTLEEYIERHPELGEQIRELFPALMMMENLGAESSGTTGSIAGSWGRAQGLRIKRLGDYRILREIGRGGMGVVFEAEQESLGRRVALKVLSSSATLDEKQIRRFEREARSAARLHHTNIVPVFGVGCQDGHHYYVMQFIQGQSLDVVLDELRRQKRHRSNTTTLPDPEAAGNTAQRDGASPRVRSTRVGDLGVTATDVANSLLTGRFAVTNPPDAELTRTEGVEGATELLSPQALSLTLPESAQKPEGPSSLDLSYLGLSGSAPSLSGAAHSLGVSADRSSLSESDRHFYRGVARVGVQVALALDYANNQGIFHRDIKPSNLLLDTRGNVWVTDFGLAKASDAADLTHTGDILGTIRYMAPERFGGQCDIRSDIYSLGLTLYELASLQPAYEGSERHRLMDRVLHEDPVRLRKVAPTVPRDLETIVEKAIARDPGQRYPSAAALAEDLQRFLDDKPVKARQTTSVERVARWCRRNPALAALSGGLLVLLVGTAVASTIAAARFSVMADKERQIRTLAEAALSREANLRRRTDAALLAAEAAKQNEAEARRRAEVNRNEAVRQQKLAEANFLLARQAVDDYLTRVSESRLLRVPGLQPLRKELLESALAYYRGFLKERKDDPSLQKDLALACTRLALITAEIGSKAEARTILDQALLIRRKLSEAEPRNQQLQLDLVDHHLLSSQLQRQLADVEGARKSCGEAYAILLKLSPQNPNHYAMISTAGGTALTVHAHESDNVEILDRFARLLKERGAGAAEAGLPTEAISSYAEAIFVFQNLTASHPQIALFKQELASQWNQLGTTENALDMSGEALAAHQEALTVLKQLVKDSPAQGAVADFQRELAATHENKGAVLEQTDKPHEAVKSYQEALAIRRRLARLNPSVTDDQRDLARSWLSVGSLQEMIGQLDEARHSVRQAINRQSLVVEMAPDVKPYARTLGLLYAQLARVERQSNHMAEALASYRQALELLEKLAPSSAEDQLLLASWRAACASVVGAGSTPLTSSEQALRKKDVEMALLALRQAAAAGSSDIDQVRKNADFNSLRERPDFKTLMDELERKRKVLVWNHDFEAAKAQAAKEKKDLFLYFGGSDWCPYDSAMRKTFLTKDTFREYADKHFVVVEFDEPQRKAKPENYPTRLRLAAPWDVSGCPTTVLADARGRRYGQTAGSFQGSMEEYLKQLDGLRRARLTRDEFLKKAVRARGVEKARLLNQALSAMPEEVLTSYADEYREILKLDPADQAGLRFKYLSQEARSKLLEAQQLAGKSAWRDVLLVLSDDFDRLQPTGSVAREGYLLRGTAHANLNEYEPAVRDYARPLAESRVHPALRYRYAALLLATGRYEEYRTLARRMLDQFGKEKEPQVLVPVLQTARLADQGADNYERLISIAEKLAKTSKDAFTFVRLHGHLLYRAGRCRMAIERLEEAFKLGKDTHPFLITDGFLLAMAHHRLGHRDEAKKLLASAEKRSEKLYADPKLDEVFKAVHATNDWQNRLIGELIRDEASALIQGSLDPAKPGARLALARACARLLQWDQAVAAYDRVIDREPTTAHVLLERAECRYRLGQSEAAEDDLARASRLAPHDLQVARELARICADRGRWDEAAAHFARALAGVPDGPAQNAIRMPICDELIQWEQVFSRVVELRPSDHETWLAHGNARARQAQWKPAAADLARAISLKPEKHTLWYQLTTLLIQAGDEAGHRLHCQRMIEQFGATQDPIIAERTAKACLLLPCSPDLLLRAASLADAALARGADHEYRPYFELVKGFVEYREGNHAAAAQRLGKLLADGNPDWDLAPPAYLILAMTQQHQGDSGKARESLSRAIQIMDQQVPSLADAGDSWNGWLMNQVLRAEAEALVLYDPIFPANPLAPLPAPAD